MPPRVSAERRLDYLKERREGILDAAIEVFGNKGLDRANVEDIAQAAGISKGTIYLYFQSKDDIFNTILEERSLIPKMVDLTESDEIPLKASLERIANRFLQGMDDHFRVFRLVLTDVHRFPNQAKRVYQNLVLKGNQILAKFLSAQVEARKIKPLDSPLITARCFIGMLIIYVLSQELLGGKKFTSIDRDVWIKEVVRVFLEGVQICNE